MVDIFGIMIFKNVQEGEGIISGGVNLKHCHISDCKKFIEADVSIGAPEAKTPIIRRVSVPFDKVSHIDTYAEDDTSEPSIVIWEQGNSIEYLIELVNEYE